MRWAGNLLIATSLIGFVLLGLLAAEVQPPWVSPGRPAAVVASKPIVVGPIGAPPWEIPKHKAGHADGTAGAGALGNAVLLGHVDSLRSGDVFRQLESVSVGDRVTVRSGEGLYTYEAVEARAVERANTSRVQTPRAASLTLFTCH